MLLYLYYQPLRVLTNSNGKHYECMTVKMYIAKKQTIYIFHIDIDWIYLIPSQYWSYCAVGFQKTQKNITFVILSSHMHKQVFKNNLNHLRVYHSRALLSHYSTDCVVHHTKFCWTIYWAKKLTSMQDKGKSKYIC